MEAERNRVKNKIRGRSFAVQFSNFMGRRAVSAKEKGQDQAHTVALKRGTRRDIKGILREGQ